jgi:hypothetical protein
MRPDLIMLMFCIQHTVRLCRSLGIWLASHCGGPGLCPGQSSGICGEQSGTELFPITSFNYAIAEV